MKRILILLFVLVLGLSIGATAQATSTSTDSTQMSSGHQDSDHMMMGDHQGMMDPQMMVDHLDQQLNLTADQKTKIQTILQDANQQAQALQNNSSGDKKQLHQQMRQLHENTHAQIRAALTPEQQQKFDSMMSSEHGKHHHDKDQTTTTTTENPK